MSQTQVEYVCYAEGGFIDLLSALDDFLAPTLTQLQALPPETDDPDPLAEVQFRPALRPLKLYHAPEDILLLNTSLEEELVPVAEESPAKVWTRTLDRINALPQNSTFTAAQAQLVETVQRVASARPLPVEPTREKSEPPKSLLGPLEIPQADAERPAPTFERVFPFKRLAETAPKPPDVLTPIVEPFPTGSGDLVEELPRVSENKPLAAGRDRLPARAVERPQPVRNLPARIPAPEPVTAATLETHGAFHDFLATRTEKKGGFQAAKTAPSLNSWPKMIIWLVGEITLFAGGGAVGAGLLELVRGESIRGGTGVLIASGLTALAVTVLIRLAPKPKEEQFVRSLRV